MSKKFHIHTFGCQMNVHDSEKIAGMFSESGYAEAHGVNDADVIVINTCSIREKAEQKFYSELGRLKHFKDRDPKLRIAVAGCIAQQKGSGLFKRFPYVDFIFGPQNIDSLEKWIGQESGVRSQKSDNKTQITELTDNPEHSIKNLPVKREGRVSAWVSIMYGCDNFCSYCVVPYTRGRERSRQVSDIMTEITELSAQGFKEITLLGQNVNSYGKNLNETNPPSPPFDKGGQGGFANQNIDFSDLLKAIHEVNGLKRIRFVTSHPRDLSKKLIRTMQDLPNVCEHIHLPVQSGSDRILSLMNRGYTFKQYKEKIDALRSAMPDIAITTDIITGFPGEDEQDFELTMNALREIEYDGIFAFKYSRRQDTAAVNLPEHLNEKTKSERLARVLDLQAEITFRKNIELEGKILEVLVEGASETDKDKLTGRTGSNKIVNFYGGLELMGTLVNVRILEAKQHSLNGEVIP
ncbi:MAG: tRNA (N6-isopentenyl adenosine(37)-C2)-methylthiotransferase MiaB [Nitrospirae bacterium]|nr:tRNA (N6-isopentenyl adenosine(37)-C2)-methylthiotransferase MiaB [Nitrospirota bacterium]